MSISFTILGCGSSLGIPRIDGHFGYCNPKNPKNYRSRCSALISSSNKNFLIDSSPDIKSQLIKSKVKHIDKIFYTHPHADQTHGINELRVFYLKKRKKIDVYTSSNTKKYLKKNFSYCFTNNAGYPATLKFKSLKKIIRFNNSKDKISIRPLVVEHGKINCLAFVINNQCAYASDVNKIKEKDIKHLLNLNYLVIDCLRFLPHPSHFNLKDALNLVERTKPKNVILTNMHSDLDYNYLLKILPKNVKPAHDGLSFYIK